jgi:hypothetical protein
MGTHREPSQCREGWELLVVAFVSIRRGSGGDKVLAGTDGKFTMPDRL